MRGMPVLDALVAMASLWAKRGEMQSGLELLLIVLKYPACDEETKKRASALQAELEAQLAPTQIAAAQDYTREKTIEAVVKDLFK